MRSGWEDDGPLPCCVREHTCISCVRPAGAYGYCSDALLAADSVDICRTVAIADSEKCYAENFDNSAAARLRAKSADLTRRLRGLCSQPALGVPFQDSHRTLPSSANGGAHDVGLPFEGPSMRVRPSMFSTLSFPSISRPARCTELETTRLQYSCDVLSFPLFCTCADCSSSCLLPGVRRFCLATPIHTVFGFTSPSSLH